jgi:protein-disulfide isomerase
MPSFRWRGAALGAALFLWAAAPAVAQSIIPPDPGTDVLEDAAMGRAKGNEDARVVVFEIADFQCPYCAQFAADVFPSIDSAYVRTGRVQWVYVNLPLPAHREAWAAAEAALCAGAVSGRFWQVHDLLYARQAEWAGQPGAPQQFTRMAREAGVDMDGYEQCVRHDRVAPLIVQDLLGATAANISGTPTFIVNRESKVVGLRSFEEWREILDSALAEE